MLQVAVFAAITGLIAFLTWLKCRKAVRSDGTKEYVLAGGGLTWPFVAGSLTLTNINTDTLVGWNGNQMLLVVGWELAGIAGLYTVFTFVWAPAHFLHLMFVTFWACVGFARLVFGRRAEWGPSLAAPRGGSKVNRDGLLS